MDDYFRYHIKRVNQPLVVGSNVWELLTLILILCCQFGCGGNDVTTPNNGNPPPTITIEKIRAENAKEVESDLPTLLNGVLVGFYMSPTTWKMPIATPCQQARFLGC